MLYPSVSIDPRQSIRIRVLGDDRREGGTAADPEEISANGRLEPSFLPFTDMLVDEEILMDL